MDIAIAVAFVEAAQDVLQAETTLEVTRGEMEWYDHSYTTDEVTVIISLVGEVKGTVLYSLAEAAALDLAGRLRGGPPAQGFDSLAQSGVAELGNVITGRAGVKLSQWGYEVKISPPTLLLGRGVILSTLDLPRLFIPLHGEGVTIGLHLALAEAGPAYRSEQKAVEMR